MARRRIFGPKSAPSHFVHKRDYDDIVQAVVIGLNYQDVGKTKGFARRTVDRIAEEVRNGRQRTATDRASFKVG